MKLQSLAIIFIIIVFPMILILSYYLSLQIDTVTLYNKYNNELIDATNDAMAAFELNTANEELSNVSDALRTIVDASTNTFINTLSTSLGLSNVNKHEIEPYIPSILYTMYDGYYIYAPTRTPVILEKTTKDGELVITDGAKYSEDGSLLYKKDEDDTVGTKKIDEAMSKTDYVLKSYMPYSATYSYDSNIATINYTLDNFMSVSAKIGDIYYTKSGYYIATDLVENFDTNWGNMGQNELKDYCLNVSNEISITVNGVTIIASADATDSVNEANRKAIAYYLTNTAFSKWVNNNLGFCTGKNMQITENTAGYISENTEIFHNFSEDDQIIFTNLINPENEDSTFNNHKYNIIKNSIQYNLNLAISSYSEMFSGSSFEMPQLLDFEWEEITKKISIVSFLQGLDCGLKEFNGYAAISSTNNEMTVIPEEIYYVKAGEFNDENSYYHRIDCEMIREEDLDFISFKSKEVKYDDVLKSDSTGEYYEYDYKNLACYDCIVQNNYLNYDSNSDGNDDKKIKLRAFLGLENDSDEDGTYINDISKTPNLPNLQKAYYIAIGKERQNLYKTTTYSKNEGIYIDNSSDNKIQWNDNIVKAEVTLKYEGDFGIVGKIYVGETETSEMISTSTRSNQTIELVNDGNNSEREITCDIGNIQVLSIKYIYK